MWRIAWSVCQLYHKQAHFSCFWPHTIDNVLKLAHLRLTMKAVKQATNSMLTPIDASTTMAISRLRLLAPLVTAMEVELEVVFRSALFVAVI